MSNFSFRSREPAFTTRFFAPVLFQFLQKELKHAVQNEERVSAIPLKKIKIQSQSGLKHSAFGARSEERTTKQFLKIAPFPLPET